MMKAAFAHWDRRIAPVFDIARRIHVAEAESGQIVAETEEVLEEDMPVRKALRLAELGIGTLVCGAISRPLYKIVAAYGVHVIPFVAGDLNEVIQAWLSGGLEGDDFAMPGCCRRGRRRRRGMVGINQEGHFMNGRRRSGMGSGSRSHGRSPCGGRWRHLPVSEMRASRTA